MIAPQWIQKELQCIHPRYFVVFDPLQSQRVDNKGRWRIRKWLGEYKRWNTWQNESTQIREIAITDGKGTDIGYAPLDRRALYDLAKGLHNARHAKETLQKIDASNARLMEQADIETNYVTRYMYKNIWDYYKTPRVIMGVAGGDRPWKH